MEQRLTVHSISNDRVQKLEAQIRIADNFINKNYLSHISRNPVVPLQLSDVDFNCARLYQITRLTFDDKEDVNDKLISVYSAIQESQSSIIIIIDSDKNGIKFYCGVLGESPERANESGSILKKSVEGNFPGTIIERVPKVRPVMNKITGVNQGETQFEYDDVRHVEAVTIVPSTRGKEKKQYVQGLEKLIDTMADEEYSAIIIAEPVAKAQQEQMKRGYEDLYSNLSSYAGQTLAYGENDSDSVAEGMMANLARSINNSVTNTVGSNTGENGSRSSGKNRGQGIHGPGFGSNSGSSTNTTTGYSSGESWSESVVKGDSTSETTGSSTTTTRGTGTSKTLTINFENKSIKNLLEKIEENVKRISECESFGLWRCAAYFISKDEPQNAVIAANCYRALMSGDSTFSEATHINHWGFEEGARSEDGNTRRVLSYLYTMRHPALALSETLYGNGIYDEQIVSPTNLVSGRELPVLMGFPNHSVTGLTVEHRTGFGRNIYEKWSSQNERKIRIGQVQHMGVLSSTEVKLNLDSFTSHCFITGSTGSGKSNTTYKLLEQFYRNDVKFLVIEPAKGEYRKEFSNIPGINILCTNSAYFRQLKINPFQFPEGIHVLEHLDRLVEIFNACWEMTAAMPAVLKDAIEQAYIKTGWDLQNSMFMRPGIIEYPTFQTVLETLPEIIKKSAYSEEVKGNYIGSLVTRVNSLTNGIAGQVFNGWGGLTDQKLFDENTIVDLSRVGSSETKSLIMGTLVLRLNEYRMANATQSNLGLRHVTVMEEAHNLLRRVDGQANPLLSKSVEMISNSIAEMRTYGEGFLIVDQSPGAVDVSAVKNTNTKIIMRLPDYSDCEIVGKAAGLSDEQIAEIAKLSTGEAIITQNNWLESVLTKVDAFKDTSFQGGEELTSYETMRVAKGKILDVFFRQKKDKHFDLAEVEKTIHACQLNRHKGSELIDFWAQFYSNLPPTVDAVEKMLMSFLGCHSIFEVCPPPSLDQADQKSQNIVAHDWFDSFVQVLNRYVDLEAGIRPYYTTLVHYLLDYQYTIQNDKACDRVRNVLYK